MTDEEKARTRAGYLYSQNSVREAKYTRNLNRYNNNGARAEDLWSLYVYPQGMVAPAVGTEGIQTQVNLIKAAVDTVVSKVSTARVRPFVNPVDGFWETRKAAKTAQVMFDQWSDERKLYPQSVIALRNACVFDKGYIKIDHESEDAHSVPPWEVCIDPVEYTRGFVSSITHIQKYYPLLALKEKITSEALQKTLDSNPYAQGHYVMYYDLYAGLFWEFFNDTLVREPTNLPFARLPNGLMASPFVEIYYNQPLKGFYATSLADDLYPVQRQVDEMVKRLDAASRNAPVGMVMVPEGSIKATDIDNGAWKVYTYRPGPEGGEPKFATPAPISQQYLDLLNMYTTKFGIEMMGLSQMSVNSRKPADLESGKALQTLEDIESDRHNVILNNYTHFLVEVAKRCIDIFPPSSQVLPSAFGRPSVTWGDLRKEKDRYSIQFSAANLLSKDPSEKLAQIQNLQATFGLSDKICLSLYGMTDLEHLMTLEGSARDYVDSIIEDWAEGKKHDFFETVDLMLLQEETIKVINALASVDENKRVLKNLVELLDKIKEIMGTIQKALKPPAPPVPPVQAAPPQAPVPVQAPPVNQAPAPAPVAQPA